MTNYYTYTLEPGPWLHQCFSAVFVRQAISAEGHWADAICSIPGHNYLKLKGPNLERERLCVDEKWAVRGFVSHVMEVKQILMQMMMQMMISHLQRQIVCWWKVSCEGVCVPGDWGEADLAEEKGPMLNQLGVESTAKSGWGFKFVYNWWRN